MSLPKSYGVALGWPGAPGRAYYPPYLGPIATRSEFPESFTNSFNQIMTQTRHVAQDNVVGFQVEFPGFYCTSSAEVDLTADTAITASVSLGATGPWTRINFGGLNQGTIRAGTRGLLSSAALFPLLQGQPFYIRNWRSSAQGIIYTSFGGAHTADACAFGVTTPDLTNSGSAMSGGGGSIAAPTAIVGITTRPSFGIIGDSRALGYNDTADSQGEIGEVCRSLGQYYAYINAAKPQMSARQWNLANKYRQQLIDAYCSEVYVELGINNFINDNQSLLQAQAANMQIYNYNAGKGKRVFGHTCHSQTTGAWTLADGSDQTVFRSAEAFNTWLLTVPAPLTAVFDPVSILQLAGNRDKWFAPGYTTDGVHPSQAAHIAVRDSGIIDPRRFL